MLSIARGEDGIVRITASGRLCRADYERFVPEFERLADAAGPLRVLIDLAGFQGWDLGGLAQEVKFDATHQNEMSRVAILGEAKWQSWGTRLAAPFFKAESRYFARGDEAAALAWLREG